MYIYLNINIYNINIFNINIFKKGTVNMQSGCKSNAERAIQLDDDGDWV